MPSGLHRTYGAHHLHFITCSCYRRLPFLSRAPSRDRFLSILEQVRQRYRFVVVGYVVMPEHIHLLITEPETGNPSKVMQVLKQRTARALLPRRKRKDPRQASLFGQQSPPRSFWQARFYDFNVWTTKKRVEKLRYMHRNPVKRRLVASPEQWRWSSCRSYLLDEAGAVRVNVGWSEISFRRACRIGRCHKNTSYMRSLFPPLPKTQGRGTHIRGGVGNIQNPGGLPHPSRRSKGGKPSA